jgi:hypothetical protein
VRGAWSFGEDEALEGSGGALGDGAEGADEMHVAAHLEAFDGDDADGAEAQLFLDRPFGDEACAESGFDGGDDGDDGVEVHGDAEIAEAEAGAAEGEFDDTPRTGAALAHEERDFGEGADGDGGARGPQFRRRGLRAPRFLRPGITAADDENEAVFKEALTEDFAAGNGTFDEAEVDFLRSKRFDDVLGVGAGDGGFDARMLLEEGAEHARQNVLRDGHGRADAECAGGFAAQVVEGGTSLVGQASTFARVAKEDGAGAGEADAAFAAVEESGAEFFFEGVNLLADRGLAEMQAFGGATEAGFFGDGAKDLQPEILHGSTLAGSWEPRAGSWEPTASVTYLRDL